MYWGVAQQHHPPVDWLHLRPVKGRCFSWYAAPIGLSEEFIKKVVILLPQKRVGESKIGATTLLMSMSWIPFVRSCCLIKNAGSKHELQGALYCLGNQHPFLIGNTSTFMVEFPLDSCMVFDICLFKNLRFACRLFQAGELHLQEVHLRGRGTGQQASQQSIVSIYSTWIGAL